MLTALKTLYEEYEVAAVRVRLKASPFAGVFGLGNDPRNHSCHDAFYEAVERWAGEFLASQPTSEQAYEAVSFILKAAHKCQTKEAYWYLYAVQGHIREMIPLLSEDACRELRDFYDEAYPAMDRPPVQREIYKLLQQYAGQQLPSRSFLQRLFGKK